MLRSRFITSEAWRMTFAGLDKAVGQICSALRMKRQEKRWENKTYPLYDLKRCCFQRKVTLIAIKVVPLNSYCRFDGIVRDE